MVAAAEVAAGAAVAKVAGVEVEGSPEGVAGDGRALVVAVAVDRVSEAGAASPAAHRDGKVVAVASPVARADLAAMAESVEMVASVVICRASVASAVMVASAVSLVAVGPAVAPERDLAVAITADAVA